MHALFLHKRRPLQWALGMASLFTLQGCLASESPDCDAPEVLKTLASLIEDNSKETFFGKINNESSAQLTAFFYDQSTIDVRRAVAIGYDRQNDRRTCQAVVQMQFPEGNAGQLLMGAAVTGLLETGRAQIAQNGAAHERVEYTVQSTNRTGSEFYVQSNMLGLINLMGFAYSSFLGSYLYAGSWDGIYACSGIDGAFELPVSFDINKGSKAVLERNTQDGGYETINLELGKALSGKGEGANNAVDKWTVALDGRVKGTTLQAQGQAKDLRGQAVRSCTLEMTQTPITFRKTDG